MEIYILKLLHQPPTPGIYYSMYVVCTVCHHQKLIVCPICTGVRQYLNPSDGANRRCWSSENAKQIHLNGSTCDLWRLRE